MPTMGLMTFSKVIVPSGGEKSDASQNCQRVTSARAIASRGLSPASGCLAARY
jgi:hypothetical protein